MVDSDYLKVKLALANVNKTQCKIRTPLIFIHCLFEQLAAFNSLNLVAGRIWEAIVQNLFWPKALKSSYRHCTWTPRFVIFKAGNIKSPGTGTCLKVNNPCQQPSSKHQTIAALSEQLQRQRYWHYTKSGNLTSLDGCSSAEERPFQPKSRCGPYCIMWSKWGLKKERISYYKLVSHHWLPPQCQHEKNQYQLLAPQTKWLPDTILMKVWKICKRYFKNSKNVMKLGFSSNVLALRTFWTCPDIGIGLIKF